MFFQNYLRLCNSKNIKPTAAALEMGIAKATVSRWKSGSKRNSATLQKIADYYGVPVETLTEEQKETAPTVTDERDLEMLSLLSRLTPEQKEMLLLQIKGLLPPQE